MRVVRVPPRRARACRQGGWPSSPTVVFSGAFGDACAYGVGEGELAAQVVGLACADAEVGADGDDPVGVAQAGAGGPAVAELLLLVGEREVLALILLGLGPAHLIRCRRVVEQ